MSVSVCVLKASHYNNWKWLKWQLLHAFPSSVQKNCVEGGCPTVADNYNFDFFYASFIVLLYLYDYGLKNRK